MLRSNIAVTVIFICTIVQATNQEAVAGISTGGITSSVTATHESGFDVTQTSGSSTCQVGDLQGGTTCQTSGSISQTSGGKQINQDNELIFDYFGTDLTTATGSADIRVNYEIPQPTGSPSTFPLWVGVEEFSVDGKGNETIAGPGVVPGASDISTSFSLSFNTDQSGLAMSEYVTDYNLFFSYITDIIFNSVYTIKYTPKDGSPETTVNISNSFSMSFQAVDNPTVKLQTSGGVSSTFSSFSIIQPEDLGPNYELDTTGLDLSTLLGMGEIGDIKKNTLVTIEGAISLRCENNASTSGISYTPQANCGLNDLTSPGSISSVPLPASAWLLMSGLLGLFGIARRKA